MLNARMLTKLSFGEIFSEFIEEKLNKIFNEATLDKSAFSPELVNALTELEDRD
jgi:hypothetical protein